MNSSDITHPKVTKEGLVAFARSIPGAWVGLRIAAILLILEGQRPGWTADVLGLSRMSLNRWIRAVNAHGVEALRNKQRPGRPSRLTPKIAQQVEKHLEQSPQAFGLNRSRWDGPTLVEHLKREFGIKLKVRQAQNWMHQLGYRLKRASYVYLQAKAEEAKRFQRKLKKTQKSGSSGDSGL
jgi:transposase